jgi:hypothetical protein
MAPAAAPRASRPRAGSGDRDDGGLRANWNTWLPQIRPHVTPDASVTPDMTPYAGNTFKKADLENIPAHDLPFGVPKWMGTGDMAWRTS